MGPYYIIFCFCLILSIPAIDKGSNLKQLVPFLGLIIILFVGLRFDSVDYWGYYRIFQRSDFADFGFPFYSGSEATSGREFIFSSLNAFVRWIGVDFSVLIFIIAMLSVGIKIRLFTYFSPYPYLSVLLYLSTVFVKDLGQIRSALAAGIVFYAIIPIHKHQFWRFLGLIILAGGIQAFAFIAFPLYWFVRIKKKVLNVLIIIALLIGFFGGISNIVLPFINYLGSDLSYSISFYLSKTSGATQNSLGMNTIFTVLLLFYCINLLPRINREFPYSYEIIVYGVVGLLAFQSFIGFPIIADRSIMLFSALPLCVLFPFAIRGSDRELKPFWLMAFFLYSLYFFNNTIHTAMPYHSVIFQ